MQNEPTPKTKKTALLRPVFFISLVPALLAALLHFLAARYPAFADFFNAKVAAVFRTVTAYLFAILPISAAELLLLSSPVLLVLLILLAKRVSKHRKQAARMLSLLLSVPLLLYSLFVFTFATGYYTHPLEERMSFTETEPDGETLHALALRLAARAEEEGRAAGVTVGERGSEMPLSHRELNQYLIKSFDVLSKEYPFLSNFSVGTKPVLLSEAMAYTGITGVYTFFTGEMNVCTAYPDFSTVFTAAHEMAHARGIAREDEANFIAFLACERAEHPYIRYAGHATLLQYVLNDLHDADATLHKEAWNSCAEGLIAEYRAYNVFVRAHMGGVASDVAGSINNAYLEGMGTGGSISYDLVVRLAVKYFDS